MRENHKKQLVATKTMVLGGCLAIGLSACGGGGGGGGDDGAIGPNIDAPSLNAKNF